MSKTELLRRYRLHALMGVAALLVWLNLTSPAPRANSAAPKLVEPTHRVDAAPLPQQAVPKTGSSGSETAPPVPLDRSMLELAVRDPFNVQPPPPPPAKVAVPAPALPVAPPPPAGPPPHELVFAGRMTQPGGGEIIYVSYAGTSMPIAAGQSLPNGYRVESISARSIELSYPSLNARARIDLPDAPKYEIR